MILKNRKDIDSKYKWNTSAIYENDSLWEEDVQKLKVEMENLSSYVGLLKYGDKLLCYLKEHEKVTRLFSKLFMYATFKHHEDTTVSKYQAMVAEIEMCSTRLQTLTSFFSPEIIAIGPDTIDKIIESTKGLSLYKKHLDFILDKHSKALSPEVEAVLAQLSDSLLTAENTYNSFCNADIKFPQIENQNGELFDLSEGNYVSFIKNSDRNIREKSFKALLSTYGEYKNMFATNLICNAKNFSNIAKIRKYASSMEYALGEDKIPTSVYNTIIDTVNANLDAHHRYMSLKKKLLNYDTLHLYDIYTPVVSIDKTSYSFEEAVSTVLKSLHVLGEEYVRIASDGIENGWCDVYPNLGKKNGAYSWGSYDTMPYFLLNYTGDFYDMFVLAHELGHSMHSYFSDRKQPFVYSQYTIFNAEVASITNEMMLLNYLIENCTNIKFKQYLILHELEQIRLIVFRQTMFAEFEKIVHEKIDAGVGLSTEDICNMYYDLNVKYFGSDVVVDNEIKMEWARIHHFYSNFYVYKYVSGYAAANMFASSILNKEEGALDNYLDFLSSGGSNYSIEIQKKCGVDMTTSKPMESVLERFNTLLDMLEDILADTVS